MYDETPEEYKFSKNRDIAQMSDATKAVNTHLYAVPVTAEWKEEQTDTSQYR